MKLVEPLRIAPERQASQKLLDGGVSGPDGQEDQIAVFVTHAAVGHQVGTLVDTVQHPGRMGRRHGVVLEGIGDNTFLRQAKQPETSKQAPERSRSRLGLRPCLHRALPQ